VPLVRWVSMSGLKDDIRVLDGRLRAGPGVEPAVIKISAKTTSATCADRFCFVEPLL
jgi:hypothetical protein